MKLLSPVEISRLKLKNRIVMPAMATGFANKDGTVTKKLIDYYTARARGGVGLIVTGEMAVQSVGLGYGYQLRIYEDSCLDGLGQLAKAIQDEGAKVFMQLAHAGRQTLKVVIHQQPVAPSPIPCLKFNETPRELGIEEIKEVESAFIEGAERAKNLGYDGVEIHSAHGYLLCEFLSPLSNKRSDKYGGNTENRTRILVNIIEGIHSRVGKDFPILVKISADEYCDGGITIKESLKIGKILEESGIWGLVVSAGNYGTFDWVVQPADKGPGCLLHLAEDFKRELQIPIMAVGRIYEPVLAEKILNEGNADLVAMGRALIADPYLPRKIMDGRIEDIDECVADNACIKALFKRGKNMVCTVNKDLATENELQYN